MPAWFYGSTPYSKGEAGNYLKGQELNTKLERSSIVREFDELQTELLVKLEPLEEASRTYSIEELDDCVIEIQALSATVDDMIMKYVDADTGRDLAVEVRKYYIPDFSNWKDRDAFDTSFAKLVRDLEA